MLTKNDSQKYQVYVDPYSNILRLDLYGHDGTPVHPMFLVYRPPQMLPTQTLNPTASATAAARATGNSKRDLSGNEEEQETVVTSTTRRMLKREEGSGLDRWMWLGIGMTGVGGVLYACF